MPENPTIADAELILKLYDLRREAELRRARKWWLSEFWPQSVDDVVKISGALGSQENAWYRQVIGYWEMAAAFVLHGALNREMFLEGSVSGEMFALFGKIQPFLEELRERLKNPNIFGNVEKVIMSSKGGPERLKQIQQRIAGYRSRASAK